MGVGLGQGLVAFLSGVQEGAEKIDERMAANMKRIQESNPDENLKSKYAAEYAKFDKDKELIASINALGGSDFSGISTAQGQVLAGGYKSIEEYQKALSLNPDLRHSMPKIGQEPIFTPSTYGLSNIKKDGTTRTTLSKTFNKLFRPEVFDENQSYADTQTNTKGSLTFGDDSSATTYRRGKSDNLSEKEVTSLESSSNRNLAQNREKTKTVIKKDKNNEWQTYTLQRNNDGATGFGAKALGGALRPKLYEGYDVISATPWQDPTQDKKDSVKEYTQELWTDKNGDLTGKDGFVMEGDKQLTYKTKIIKTNEDTDVVDIGGGETLTGWKYLQQDPIEATADKGTADMQNSAFEVEQFISMYNASPERKELMDKKLIDMGLPPGEMTEMAARELLTNFKSFEQNVNSGNYMNVQDIWLGAGDTTSKDELFDSVTSSEVATYTLDYLESRDYYNDLKEPLAYEVFINSEAHTFANKHKISVSRAVDVIEKLSQTAFVNESGDFLNFINDYTTIGTPLSFDSNRKVLGDSTVVDLIARMEKFKTENPKLADEPWGKIADYLVGKINKAR